MTLVLDIAGGVAAPRKGPTLASSPRLASNSDPFASRHDSTCSAPWEAIISRALIGIAAMLGLVSLACDNPRQRPGGDGVHPEGFAVEGTPVFHGDALRARGYPLDECRGCHGGDFAGGDVGISCGDGAGCHTDGVVDCAGTCHGDDVTPAPGSGGHARHIDLLECASCHPVPGGLDEGEHIDGDVDVILASWDAASRTCADSCHFGESPGWDDPERLGCDGCHQQSPAHDRFDRVVSEATCGDCHAGSPDTGHVDGELVIAIDGCADCHGSGGLGAPPPALDGSTDPGVPAVGAHRRHVDGSLSDRIGVVVPCSRCHPVPGDVLAPGHLDDSAPVDVDVILGDYDPATNRCVVSCHFDRDPGPLWTDSSGAERACDACHGFPPVLTRIGTNHPPSAPQLSVCLDCHTFTVPTHVDGEVNFR
jgi:hypothetical protein